MDTNVIKKVEESFYKKRPNVRVGDTVRLYLKIKEAGKERTQIFEGVVIAIKGSGLSRNLVARKISYGVGVEKIVPFHAPALEKIEVIKRGSVRRAKLYYLRGRVGRRALKAGETTNIYLTDEEDVGVDIPVTGEPQVPVTGELQEEVTEESVEKEVETPTEEGKEGGEKEEKIKEEKEG